MASTAPVTPASYDSLRNCASIDVRIARSTSGVNHPARAPARSGTMMSRRSSRAMKIRTPFTFCCENAFAAALCRVAPPSDGAVTTTISLPVCALKLAIRWFSCATVDAENIAAWSCTKSRAAAVRAPAPASSATPATAYREMGSFMRGPTRPPALKFRAGGTRQPFGSLQPLMARESGSSLRAGSLTFNEVLATSVALIGPSMTPILIAPYMFALAGNGTWLAYVFGGTMLVFVALCINQFARRSSAAGSMYGYVADHLGPRAGAIAGWTLLWAYGFVATAVLGAMALFVERLLLAGGMHVPVLLVVVVLAALAWQAAYRGVQVSAIVMLVLEAISVGIILILVAIVLHAHGPSLDANQVRIKGGFPGGIGLAIAFAIFSFVGFESATAFGAEAKAPLVTIPRAVIGSVIFAAAFFVVATYAEIVGLAHLGRPLDKEQFPLQTLVDGYGLGYLAIPITIGAVF